MENLTQDTRHFAQPENMGPRSLPQDTQGFIHAENMDLRRQCSLARVKLSDLDEFGWILYEATSFKIVQFAIRKMIFKNNRYQEDWHSQLLALRYGPGQQPIFTYLLQLIQCFPHKRELYLDIIDLLAIDLGVPVDSTDLSGTTALMHAMAVSVFHDPEVARILVQAGADRTHRNLFGNTYDGELLLLHSMVRGAQGLDLMLRGLHGL